MGALLCLEPDRKALLTPRFCALSGSETPQGLNAGLAQSYQPGLEPLGGVWPADRLCHWAVERGAEDSQWPKSGLTAQCVQSPQIGLVSCLSYLHAQLIVPYASQNFQV